MALKVSVTVNVKVSRDNVPNPQELSFSSGEKNKTDTSTYSESAGFTFHLATSDTADTQLPLGSLAECDVLYILSPAAITIKPVPTGGSLGATPAYTLVADVPLVLPVKLSALYVANPTGSAVDIVVGAVGN